MKTNTSDKIRIIEEMSFFNLIKALCAGKVVKSLVSVVTHITKRRKLAVVSSCAFLLLCSLGVAKAVDNPVASKDAIVTSGNMRFTVLTPQMIRIECSNIKAFDDRATLMVVNRNLPVPKFTAKEKDGYLIITTDALTLRYKIGANPVTKPEGPANLNITMSIDGSNEVWYPGKKDVGNLKGTCRTLDGQKGNNMRSRMENGIISRSGWVVIDDSYYAKRADGSYNIRLEPNDCGFNWLADPNDKNASDWYFLGYGRNYKKALYDYTQIAGKIPMPPNYIFGYWYSKYEKYTTQDFKNIITDCEDNGIPIDVLVIDTNWHINGWTGWSWNKDLIPDPAELISWLHNHNVKVTLNLHPAYGIDKNEDNFPKVCKDLGLPSNTANIPWQLWNVKFYKSLFKNIIRLRKNEGVDFWWIDWQQWLVDKQYKGLSETYWCNHVFFEDMRVNHPEKRPVIFHRWAGLGSHRYQIGFSGDCFSTFPTLAFQPYFTATASNVGYGYWGHDLGGHIQLTENDPEMYLRWLQFGVFTPIFRTHPTNIKSIERRIWKYPNFQALLDAMRLRYSLFPYIYSNARYAYDTGISICRPLYYDNPNVDEAYSYENEYMFGDSILVAPITEAAGNKMGISRKSVWLPDGEWLNVANNEMLKGGTTYALTFTQSQIPYFIKKGAIIPTYPPQRTVQKCPNKLIIKAVCGASGSMSLYEDDGDSQEYSKGVYATTLLEQKANKDGYEFKIGARKGKFKGMLTARGYTFELLNSIKPIEVKLYRKRAKDKLEWRYDQKAKKTFIEIPETKCSDEIRLVVKIDRSADASKKVADEKAIDLPKMLWITGSAVPGGVQKLIVQGDEFKFYGTLNEGEVKLMTTDVAGPKTVYLVPEGKDLDIVSGSGIKIKYTKDAAAPGWGVSFDETAYRISVNLATSLVKGATFFKWDELYLVGGPAECGWDCKKALPFTVDASNKNLFIWTGKLTINRVIKEGNSFKLLGQRNWGPKSLHPVKAYEKMLKATKYTDNGFEDAKWVVEENGTYTIKVDVLNETFSVEKVSE